MTESTKQTTEVKPAGSRDPASAVSVARMRMLLGAALCCRCKEPLGLTEVIVIVQDDKGTDQTIHGKCG